MGTGGLKPDSNFFDTKVLHYSQLIKLRLENKVFYGLL